MSTDPAAMATSDGGAADGARILVVDNYDSFVFNLVHYLAQLGARVEVWRNDDPRFEDPGFHQGFDGILLSPGPGTPEEAGVCVRLLREVGVSVPIFGVCLGLQAMAVAYGGVVERAPQLRHGKTSPVLHGGAGVFEGLDNPVVVTRYHSLAVVPDTVPGELEVTAWTEDGIIMGLRHRTRPIEAVQFHPESVMSQAGHRMLGAWLARCGMAEAPVRALELAPLTRVSVTN